MMKCPPQLTLVECYDVYTVEYGKILWSGIPLMPLYIEKCKLLLEFGKVKTYACLLV